MLTKEGLLESIKAMPEDKFDDINVLPERIVILEKLEKGEKILLREEHLQLKKQNKNFSDG